MKNKNHTLLLTVSALLIIFTVSVFSVFDSPKYNSLDAQLLSSAVHAEKAPSSPATERATVFRGRININTATHEELMNLSRIGEKKALAIIDYRNKNGSFRNVYELANVSGISENIVEENLHLLTV